MAMNAKTRKKLRNRKYGRALHRRTRMEYVPLVATGLVRCARGEGCSFAELVGGVWVGGLIEPGTPWDLGHDDWTGLHSGPEHPYCNRTAPHRCVTSRQW